MRHLFLTASIAFVSLIAKAQEVADTVKVPLAKSSQIIFTIKDRSDLETLKHYDFKSLFDDIINRLEKNDTSYMAKSETAPTSVAKQEKENRKDSIYVRKRYHWRHTNQALNFDLGMNNFVSNGKFPDGDNEKYSVKPWGSWYVGISSIQRSKISKNFYLEWGIGVSWYNFKFQDQKVLVQKDDQGVSFIDDPRAADPSLNFTKSKLTATYINASLVPVLDFGKWKDDDRKWRGHSDSFRIGLGPYVGYRVNSYAKQVYTKDGDDKKEHNKDNFYLNNLRYGMRLQLGFRETDFFFNYDLNKLFANNKGPDLNAFSFGVIF